MRKAVSVIYGKVSEGTCALENAKQAVLQIDGVFDVEANHILGMLKVQYDQDRVTLDRIRRTVKEACN
jgi:copper chaperone CopZ